MKVSSVMTKKVVTAGTETQADLAYLMMEKNNFRHLPIVDSEGLFVAMATRSRLRNHCQSATPALEFCRKEFLTVTPDSDIRIAAQLMVDKKIGALAVVDLKNRLVGIITESDILSTFVQFMSYLSDSDEVSVTLPDNKVSLDKALQAIKEDGTEVLSISMSKSDRKGRKDYSFRVQSPNVKGLRKKLSRQGFEIVNF